MNLKAEERGVGEQRSRGASGAEAASGAGEERG